ncbi:hypothetical protein [Aquisalinus flavus]|uniref:Uncharacterized protein n=1 Tax=Aquisalinus flavus TaxID=1526572 RepID=A0A8J2Y2Z6_9PROT|nr:hypothetical protein [Aquisalinus flavus]MBD0426908.1 hypothetical protein [Aquisalinus flavus]UNE46752.1 hypothetical protein FF099_01080 [Aquisalinus flavus]GGC96888.1 hypothetical protein GCM10011342_02210 [Aquisalinus flavus]
MPASAQVRGSAAVDAETGAEIAAQGAQGWDGDIDDRLAGGRDSRGDDRDLGYGRNDRSYDDTGYDRYRDDDRDYGRDRGQVRGEDGSRYQEQARSYTDEYRRYSDNYSPRYDDSRRYDRDYRSRYEYPDRSYRYSDDRYRGSSFDFSVDLGDVTIGYSDGYRDGYYVYNSGRSRYRHRDWRSGYTSYAYRCHPVSYSEWHRGRRVPVTATMCYDRYGYGYVVPGSVRYGRW